MSEELFNRAQMECASVVRAAVRRVIDSPDCEDVEADIWASLWTALRTFRGDASLKTFVFPIVRRRIADFWRNKYREERLMESAKGRLASTVRAEDYLADPPVPDCRTLLRPSELRVMRQLAVGKSNSQIAEALFIGHSTVHTHMKALYRKTGLTDRGALALLAFRFFRENE